MGRLRDYQSTQLRASRAEPPGFASNDLERRAIYGSALQQFEELLAAAKAVGPASQPLLLFYALSQAGRAIVAARGKHPHVHGHGLREDRTVARSEAVFYRRVERVARRDAIDTFGAVARATNGGDFSGSLDVGAVWAAIPSVHRIPDEAWRPEWRLALDVHTGMLARRSGGGLDLMVTSMSGNPLVQGLEVLADDRYPTLPSKAKGTLRGGPNALPAGSWIADVIVPGVGDDESTLDRIAPKPYGGKERALIPTLPGQGELLSPLMLWWILLFGLSIIARYDPAGWAAALDVQNATEAVPLETLLEQGMDKLPTLVFNAIFQIS